MFNTTDTAIDALSSNLASASSTATNSSSPVEASLPLGSFTAQPTPLVETRPQELDVNDYAPGTRNELIGLKTAQVYLSYEKSIANTVSGLRRACKYGYGPQTWLGRNEALLTTYEALERWIALPHFTTFYKSKLVVGSLPAHDPERDYISLATIFPEMKGNV